MQPWILVLIAPFFGSFAECLAQRLPMKRSVIIARSQCDHCGGQLRAVELVPVVSWLALRGKCGACAAPIPPVTLIAELCAALLAVWAVAVVPGWLVWPTAALGWALLLLALMDFHHLVLADVIVLPLLILGIAVSFALSQEQGIAGLIGAALGGGGAFVIRETYRRLRGRIGLGLGDVKLLAAAGAWVGWAGLPSVLFIASVSALAIWLVLAATRSARFRLQGGERIPFGIFLALGLWIVWLHGPLQIGAG